MIGSFSGSSQYVSARSDVLSAFWGSAIIDVAEQLARKRDGTLPVTADESIALLRYMILPASNC